MKKIGLVGGISWTSTIDYYRYINEEINKSLGGLEAAECIIYSLNFGEIQNRGWVNSYDLLLDACLKLRTAGAQGIVLCANTAHMFVDRLQDQLNIPIINIIEETAKAIVQSELDTIALLGTKMSMEMEYYITPFNHYGITALIPKCEQARETVHDIVKNELGIGLVKPKSKETLKDIANELVQNGAQGIVLGCTELPLILSETDFTVPIFDTTLIHARSIVRFALT